MIEMIFNIVEHKLAGSFELVVATQQRVFDLFEKLPNFKLIVDYDSFEPTEKKHTYSRDLGNQTKNSF